MLASGQVSAHTLLQFLYPSISSLFLLKFLKWCVYWGLKKKKATPFKKWLWIRHCWLASFCLTASGSQVPFSQLKELRLGGVNMGQGAQLISTPTTTPEVPEPTLLPGPQCGGRITPRARIEGEEESPLPEIFWQPGFVLRAKLRSAWVWACKTQCPPFSRFPVSTLTLVPSSINPFLPDF